MEMNMYIYWDVTVQLLQPRPLPRKTSCKLDNENHTLEQWIFTKNNYV